MTDLNTSPDAAETPSSNELPMFDPAAFAPLAEKPEVYGSDRHGLEQAANDLTKQRAKAEAPIRVRRMREEDVPEKFTPRDAAARLDFSRKMEKAVDLQQRNPDWVPEFTGAVVRETSKTEHDGRHRGQRGGADDGAQAGRPPGALSNPGGTGRSGSQSGAAQAPCRASRPRPCRTDAWRTRAAARHRA
jgi:hypothetical protein